MILCNYRSVTYCPYYDTLQSPTSNRQYQPWYFAILAIITSIYPKNFYYWQPPIVLPQNFLIDVLKKKKNHIKSTMPRNSFLMVLILWFISLIMKSWWLRLNLMFWSALWLTLSVLDSSWVCWIQMGTSILMNGIEYPTYVSLSPFIGSNHEFVRHFSK